MITLILIIAFAFFSGTLIKKRSSQNEWVALGKVALLPAGMAITFIALTSSAPVYLPYFIWQIALVLAVSAAVIGALGTREGIIQLILITKKYDLPEDKPWHIIDIKHAINMPSPQKRSRKIRALNSVIKSAEHR